MKERIRELAGLVACKCGFHRWRYDCACITDETFQGEKPPKTQRVIALGWRVCERCHESEVRFVLR